MHGANESLSGGFAAIPGIAPRVAPRIVGFVLIKSWEAIPRMEFRIPRMEFPIPRAAPRIPRNSPRAPRMAFSLRELLKSFGWGQKVYVENVYVFSLSLNLSRAACKWMPRENYFLNSPRAPRIPRNSPRAPRMAFSLRERFSWNWGGPQASEKCPSTGCMLYAISASPPPPDPPLRQGVRFGGPTVQLDYTHSHMISKCNSVLAPAISRVKLAKFSAKLVANFRRSLEGDFRACFAGKIVRSIFHQNSTANFTVKLHYDVLGCGGP